MNKQENDVAIFILFSLYLTLIGTIGYNLYVYTLKGAVNQILSEIRDIKNQPLIDTKKKPTVYRIGVIDTGLNLDYLEKGFEVKVCADGHYNYATNKHEIGYMHNHGTAVIKALVESLDVDNYCLVIIQVQTTDNKYKLLDGLARAERLKLTAINISMSGEGYNQAERNIIEGVALSGGVVFIAAGNNRLDMNKACLIYPACYKDIKGKFIVGALNDKETETASYTNYGTIIDIWSAGYSIVGKDRWEGTSMASPRALADYVNALAEIK